MRKRLANYTAAEEESLLMAEPANKATLQDNKEDAEKAYLQAAALKTDDPKPHRGLGLLYEEQGKLDMAMKEYRLYLSLAPQALDAFRIQQRLKKIENPSIR